MTTHMTTLALLAAIATAMPACDQELPPASQNDAIGACYKWSGIVETKLATCLGWDQAMLADQIAAAQDDCWNEVHDRSPSCADNLWSSFEDCADRDADRSCDDLCANGFCYVHCSYVCPADTP